MEIAAIVLELDGESVLDDEGERAGPILLASLLLSFLLIRTSARLMHCIRPGTWCTYEPETRALGTPSGRPGTDEERAPGGPSAPRLL